MTIVCLGWGSLIWDPRELSVSSDWEPDGPPLPVEFARQSKDGRITLVITGGAAPVPVYWAALDVSSLDEAKARLAAREGVSAKFIHRSIGFWSQEEASDHPEVASIGDWARERSHRGAVWTALKPKLGNAYYTPKAEEVVAYLKALDGEPRKLAERYIREAPIQIATAYRQEIEEKLGWTPRGDG